MLTRWQLAKLKYSKSSSYARHLCRTQVAMQTHGAGPSHRADPSRGAAAARAAPAVPPLRCVLDFCLTYRQQVLIAQPTVCLTVISPQLMHVTLCCCRATPS